MFIMGCFFSKEREEILISTDSYLSKYSTQDFIGSGAFAEVHRCYSFTDPGRERAVKVMPNRIDDGGYWSSRKVFYREMEILKTLHHPHVVRFFEAFDESTHFYLVMELCLGHELFDLLVIRKRLPEPQAVVLIKQMVSALFYIHSAKIVYRDVKAENWVFTHESHHTDIKLIDFGMATRIGDKEKLREICGSPPYLAPELIGQAYNKQVDCWALGVLAYVMLYGRYPYKATRTTPQELFMHILGHLPNFPKGLSQAAEDFLRALIQPDMKKRLTMAQAAHHSFLQDPHHKLTIRTLLSAPELGADEAALEELMDGHALERRSWRDTLDEAEAARLRLMYQKYAKTHNLPYHED